MLHAQLNKKIKKDTNEDKQARTLRYSDSARDDLRGENRGV